MISGVLAARRVGRGETVGLRFEPFGCMIFPHHSMAPSDESPAVAEVDANVLFVEGSCVLLVGDQTGSRINPSPPVIGGALRIYGRTAHSRGVCT